jgi:regulator of replication initiation timing
MELKILDSYIKDENETLKQNTAMIVKENDQLREELKKLKEEYATTTQGKIQETGKSSGRYKLRKKPGGH